MTIDRGAQDRTHAPIPDDKHDAFAFADDGEHATVWGIDRLADETVEVTYYRFESGLVEQDGTTEQFDVDAGTSTVDWGEELAEESHQEATRLARQHWESA